MKPVLIYLRPLDQQTGQRVDVRVADGPNADSYGVGGTPWEPAILTRPKLSIELMSPDMDGKVQAGTATFDIALGQIMSLPRAIRMYWRGAAVVIHNTGALEGPGAIPDFWGYVTSARLDLDTGRLSVTAEVSTALIDKPLLTGEFTGGGGITGEAAKRGVLFPAGFGTVKNIQPVWFDTIRNIGMIDGYANTLSIDWLGEGLSSFGARVADYPTYDALAAAIDNKTIGAGQWGTCVAQGLVGLGAPPVGIITVHATFGSNRIGAMMKRILLTHAKVPVARVDTAAFDALDQLVPKPVHYWTAADRDVKDLLEALAQSCNATPLVSFQNVVTVTRAIGGLIVGTLDRSGAIEPRVIDWQWADVDPPYYLLKARAARPGSVLTDDQVNYVDTLEDKGVYSATTMYRAGNLVWLADGSQWLYQNGTASMGHAPPTNAQPDGNGYVQDAWWFRRQPPKTASDFTYQDGTPIQALQPRQAGADPTSTNTAAAITNQGPGATALGQDILNSYLKILANGSFQGGGGGQVTYGGLGGGALGLLANLFFGSPLLLEQSGGAAATLANFKTLLGVSSGFTGQGSLATLSQLALGSNYLTGFGAFAGINQAAYGSNLLTGFGALAPLGSIAFGSNYLLEQAGGAFASLNAFKTILGISSGFTGQDWGATASEAAASNVRVPVGANSIVNSSFARPGYAFRPTQFTLQWNRPDYSGSRSVGYIHPSDAWGTGPTDNYTDITTYGGWNGPYEEMVKFCLPVAPGDLVGVRSLVATHRCAAALYVIFLDRNRQNVYAPATPARDTGGGGSNGENWINQNFSMIATAPPGAAYAQWMLRCIPNGGTDPYVFFSEPWLGKLQPGATVIPAYTHGPADPIADQTSVNTASAIAGQGAFATVSSAAYGSSLLTGFGALAPLGNILFGSNYLLESAGVPATNANFKTILGTAASFTGQGGLATVNTISGDTQLSGVMAARLSPYSGDVNFLSAGRMAWTSGGTVQSLKPGEAGANVTESRTAAAITGQTIFATLASGTSLDNAAFGMPTRLGSFGGFLSADQMKYQGGPAVVSVASLRPAEAGSNITENRTAAAFLNQGALATASTINADSQLGGTISQRLAPFASDPRYLSADRMAWIEGDTLQNYKPQEKGANVTEARTAAAITGQGYGATAARSSVDNLYNALGTNTQIDSSFSRTSATWFAVGSSISGARIDFNRADYSGRRSVAYLHADGVNAAVGSLVDATGLGPWAVGNKLNRMLKYSMPVKVGDTIGIRVLAGAHRCTATLFLLCLGSNGELITAPSTSVGWVPGGGGGADNFGVMQFTFPITDPNLVAAQFMLRMNGTGENDPYLFFSEPWLGKLAPGQTVIPPYTPGPADPTSDQTLTNTAAGFTGQGAFATKDTVPFGSPLLPGFGSLGGRNYIKLGVPSDGTAYIANQSDSYVVTDALAITSLGVSSGFAGQGSLATKSAVSENDLGGYLPNRLAGFASDQNYLRADRMAWLEGSTVQSYKPQEGGANITENRTSAAITGQGFGATASRSAIDNAYVPLGSNRIVNSNFARGTYAFLTQANQFNIDYPGYGGQGGQRHVMYARYTGTLQAGQQIEAIFTKSAWVGAGTLEDNRKFGMSVVPGQRVYFGGRTGLHRCTGTIFALCWTAAGGMIYAPAIGLNENGGGSNADLTTMQKAESYFDVPTKAALGSNSDIAYVTLLFRMNGNGQTDCFFFLAEPKLGVMQPGQTVIPDYGDGPTDPVADQTGVNTAAGFTGQGPFATASNLARDSIFSGFFQLNAFSLGYSITRSDGSTTVTESMAITSLGISSGFVNQGGLATKNQAGAGDIAPSAVQLVTYQVLQNAVSCPVGN